MTKLLRFYPMLLTCFLAFLSIPIFGQVGTNSPCLGDTLPPVFERCPQDVVLLTADSCAFAQWAEPLAFDNCGITKLIGSYQSGTCFKVGITPVVYTAQDSAGNKSICSFSVIVNRLLTTDVCATDTIKPRFTSCPAGLTAVMPTTNTTGTTATVLDTCLRVQWATPVATDNCSTPSVTSDFTSGMCFKIGTTTVTYTATDAKGNKGICSFAITINRPNIDSVCALDTIKPHFTTCPINSTFTTLDSCMKIQWAIPTAVDNCSPPSVTSSIAPGSCFKLGATPVVYYARDAKGNVSTCSFTITVLRTNLDSLCALDTTKPSFTFCPANLTTYISTTTLTGTPTTTLDSCLHVQWPVPTAVDNCSTPIVTANFQSGSCFKVGTTEVVYTAVDAKGNKSICAFTITVNRPNIDSLCATDTIKPRFTKCPLSATLTTLDSCARVQWETPVATDNCSVATLAGNIASGSCFKLGSTTVIYYAVDARGNATTCSFVVTVVRPNTDSLCVTDTIKPRFTKCPLSSTLTTLDSCARIQWETPVATDNCSTPIVTSSSPSGTCFKLGATTVVYYAKDAKGNIGTCSFTITVVRPNIDSLCATDTIKPRFTKCPLSATLTTLDSCARVQWETPVATDNCSIPTVTSSSPSGTCFKLGTTTVNYYAIDAKGNTGTCSFTVTVVNPCATDTIKPKFVNCPTNKTLTTFDSCARVQWTAPIATDNCSIPKVTSDLSSTSCFKPGVTPVTYTATDAKGNTSTCSFTVTVINPCATDTIKPRFTSCPQGITVSTLDSCTKVQWNAPLAIDNCSVPTIAGNIQSGTCFKTGVTTVTYTATDAKGNASICSFTVTVKNPCANDTIKPIFYNCPSNLTAETKDTAAKLTWRLPIAIDNCGVKTLTSNYQPGASFKLGTTTVTYTATDAAGNVAYCSFTVTVSLSPCALDSIAPVFANCPKDITVSTASTSAIAQWTKPTATDNCVTPSVTSTASAGSSFPIGTTTVVYTAKDAKNNISTCSFSVIVTKQTLVIDSTKCYVLVARSSKKALSIASASTAPAADAVQWTYLGGLNQKWSISNADSNSVNLTVKHTNMNLDTRWGVLTNGSKLMQWTKSTSLTQKWQLIPLSDGYFKVINKASGRALSVNGGATATSDGSLLVQLDYTGLTSQQWSIEAVACTSSTTPVAFATDDVLEVSAKPESHRARIEWVDNTGYKNDYYQVEKLNATSGKFESLAVINNKVFDAQLTSQTVYDETPTEGDNFYRVKVVYLDSLTKISPVQKVDFSNLQAVKIFPNPASDFVDVDLSTYNATSVNIDLYNSFGQKVAGKTVQNAKNTVVHFDISEQQSGNYLIHITAQGKRDVMKPLHIVH